MGDLVNARRVVRAIWERATYIERKNILTSLQYSKNVVKQMGRVNWLNLPDYVKDDLTSYTVGKQIKVYI